MDLLRRGALGIGELVERLSDPHRYVTACRRLLDLGAQTADAARVGLSHPDEHLRKRCCKVLVHALDEPGINALTSALRDRSAAVHIQARHALSCDRCKSDSCRPSAQALLHSAVQLLVGDPDPLVRAMAAELVAAFAHTHSIVVGALDRAHDGDRHRPVCKKPAVTCPAALSAGARFPPAAGDRREAARATHTGLPLSSA